MSRSAHHQSTYELRKLPNCSRCDTEFIHIWAAYKAGQAPVREWECPKCHKVVAYELLKEEKLLPEDAYLQKTLRKYRAQETKRKRRKR
jgi:hypothetical protein